MASRVHKLSDVALYALCGAAALFVAALFADLVLRMIVAAAPAALTLNMQFLTQTVWDPSTARFGALGLLWGTFYVALIALLIAAPIGIAAALYITQWAPPVVRACVDRVVHALAAIPSVAFGLWGLWALAPRIPGHPMLAAGLLVGLMLLPTIIAASGRVMTTVPPDNLLAAKALGATPWEAVKLVVLRPLRAALGGAALLGLGRALGEAIVVAMIIGNPSVLVFSWLSPQQSLGSVIANQLVGADRQLAISALIEIALLLLVISLLVTLAGRRLLGRSLR